MARPTLPTTGATSWDTILNNAINAVSDQADIGAAGIFTKARATRALVFAVDFPAALRPSATDTGTSVWVCDGTADDVEINAAIATVSASNTTGRGTNGGTVQLAGRAFPLAAPVKVRAQTQLRGEGMHQTFLKPTWSSTAGDPKVGAIELDSTTLQHAAVSDLGIDGNWTFEGSGIYFAVGDSSAWDSELRISNIYVMGVRGQGVRLVAVSPNYKLRGLSVDNLYCRDTGLNGLYTTSVDSHYYRVDVGSSGSYAAANLAAYNSLNNDTGTSARTTDTASLAAGIYSAGANNKFVTCKAWYSDGYGFAIRHGSRNQFVGCESQDNFNDGFYSSSSATMYTGCMADSNGYGWTGSAYNGSGSGFRIGGSATLSACMAFDKLESGRAGTGSPRPAQQIYGINIAAAVNVMGDLMTSQNATASYGGSTPANGAINSGGNALRVLDTATP